MQVDTRRYNTIQLFIYTLLNVFTNIFGNSLVPVLVKYIYIFRHAYEA